MQLSLLKKLVFLGLVIMTFPVQAFDDVSITDETYTAVEYLEQEEVINDAPQFFPDENISRAEFLKMALTARNG